MTSEDSGHANALADADLIAAHTAGDPHAFGELLRRHRDRMWAVALRTLPDPEEAADALQEAFTSAFRAAGSLRTEVQVTTWLHRLVVNACLDRLRRRQARPTVPLPEAETAPVDPPQAAARTLARKTDRAEITALLEQSSLGTDAARSLRSRATPIGVDRILQRAKELAPTRDPLPTPTPVRFPGAAGDAMADRETLLMVREALAALPEAQRVPIVLIDVEGYSVEETAQMLGIAVGTVKSRAARGRMRLRKLLEHLRVPIESPHPHWEETTDRGR